MRLWFRTVIVVFVSLYLGIAGSWAESNGHQMIHAKDLKWVSVPSLPPGAKVAVIEGPMNKAVHFTVRIKFPPNYNLPAHWHPAVERVTVLAGTLYVGMGDKLDRQRGSAIREGGVMIMQPKTNHFVWTKEGAVVQLSGIGPWGITYVTPSDDPRRK